MLPFLKCVISQSCSFNNHLLSPQGLSVLLGTGYTTLETTSLRPERWYTVGKAACWNCSRHLVWKSYSPRIPSYLALNTTHAMVGIKFNVSCWGHFLSHELSQNPGVFVARKSEAALACSSHCRSPCGPLLWVLCERLWLPAFCYSHQPPMWVPTSPGCFGVGPTAFPTSKEAFTPTAFCAWELLSFLAQTPLPSFQNINFHSFLPVPPQTHQHLGDETLPQTWSWNGKGQAALRTGGQESHFPFWVFCIYGNKAKMYTMFMLSQHINT